MKNNSLCLTIETLASPEEVFEALLNVSSWWGFDDLAGPTKALNDIFIITHPGMHYSKQQIIEFVPGARLIWQITESRLSWLKNPDEWTGTCMIFELFPGQLRFTHDGLTPELECYQKVSEGWKTIIGDYFLKVLQKKAG